MIIYDSGDPQRTDGVALPRERAIDNIFTERSANPTGAQLTFSSPESDPSSRRSRCARSDHRPPPGGYDPWLLRLEPKDQGDRPSAAPSPVRPTSTHPVRDFAVVSWTSGRRTTRAACPSRCRSERSPSPRGRTAHHTEADVPENLPFPVELVDVCQLDQGINNHTPPCPISAASRSAQTIHYAWDFALDTLESDINRIALKTGSSSSPGPTGLPPGLRQASAASA